MAAVTSAPLDAPRSATGHPEKLRLGDVLVQQRLISQEQLQQTLELQRQTGKKTGRLLIESGGITEELLANWLARQLRIPFVNLKTFPFRRCANAAYTGFGKTGRASRTRHAGRWWPTGSCSAHNERGLRSAGPGSPSTSRPQAPGWPGRSVARGVASFSRSVALALARELVRMQLAQGQPDAVLSLLNQYQRLLPGQADLWAIRGDAAQRIGQHAQASQAYLMALKIRPGEPRWMLGAAASLAALGQLAAAAELAEQARGMDAARPEVLAYLKQLGVSLRERYGLVGLKAIDLAGKVVCARRSVWTNSWSECTSRNCAGRGSRILSGVRVLCCPGPKRSHS